MGISEEVKSISEEVKDLVAELADHIDDGEKIDSRAHGWKAANKRLRKTTLAVEKRLKALRKASIALEK